ncbi:hypothetical protein HDU89_007865 [Geranomyces variabilis]|nr:hypothetical protein HDU89_007865 [Geranomyces variabilis]
MSTYDTVAVTPAEAKISDLAATARKSEKNDSLWKRFNIPLLILAPVLILLSLVAVVLPVSMVLITSSHDVTEYLSETYFASIMASTQNKIYHSLDPLRYALIGWAPLPSTALAMSHRYNILGETAMWQQMAYLTTKYKLDATQCYTATWAPGVPPTPPGSFDTINQTWVQIGHRFFTPRNRSVVSLMDMSSLRGAMSFDIDQTTFALVNATNTYFPPLNMTAYALNGYIYPYYSQARYDNSYSPTLQQLLVPNPRREVFYTLSTTPEGLFAASIAQVYQSADPALPYSCGASFTIDVTWSQMLVEAAGVNSANKILLLDSKDSLKLVSTSNRVVTYDQAFLGHLDKAFNETLSQSLRAAVIAKYGTYSGLVADPNLGKSFEAQVEGNTWILLVDRVQFTTYDADQIVVVLAVPRASIYSPIDAANKKSLGLAIGLSVGIGMLMALLFALIVTPLRRLAHAMGLLTSLDFASLHKGDILEQKSAISEIRNVQHTFSTMVKAFAGGIKQNRDLQSQQSRQGGATSQTQSRMTTGSGTAALVPNSGAPRVTREQV